MPDAASNHISDDDVAFLCNIGEFELPEGGEHTTQLRRLIAAGFIVPANAGQALAKFQLTAKAEQILCARGVGLKLRDLDFEAAVDHDGAAVRTVGDYVLRKPICSRAGRNPLHEQLSSRATTSKTKSFLDSPI